ncbi:MAG: GUN4 domain-containing protein [Cyanobacteria bacterium P01_F01_bin.33]
MVDTNTPPSSLQLSDIQIQLGQLSQQLSAVATQLERLGELPARVERLEERLALVGDVQRFERLQELLATEQWSDADRETIVAIVSSAGREELEDLSPNDILRFPCEDLQVIDRLWSRYSQGRFGFGVQLKMYVEAGGTAETAAAQNAELVERWGDRLGWRDGKRWRKCSELDYSLDAPLGCHPSRWWNSPYGSKMTNYFLSRLLSCQR